MALNFAKTVHPADRNAGNQRAGLPPSARAFTFLLVILVLLTAFVAVAGAKEKDDGDHGSNNGHHERPADGEREPRKPGRIEQQASESDEGSSSFAGRYIGFELDPDTCSLRNLELYGEALFDEIQLAGVCEITELPAGRGSTFRLSSDIGEIRLHDAPNGLIRFDAEEGAIHFDWSDELALEESEEDLSFSLGNLTGTLRMHLDAVRSLNDDQATLGGSAGSFWVHPLGGGSAVREGIREGIRDGVVGGEIDLLSEAGDVTHEVLSYDAIKLEASEQAPGHFRFVVDANLTEGRVIVVNVAPGILKSDKLAIRYWDVENSTEAFTSEIFQADGLSDVMEILAGEKTEFWVVSDATGTHVMLALPHFSVHIFDVVALVASANPSIMVGVLVGLAFVGAAAWGLRPSRRDQE